jgi:acetolactate synthase I/II/III large subunit
MSRISEFAGSSMTLGEALVQVLDEAGIDMVFGIPGGNVVAPDGFVDGLAVSQDRVRTVLVREESLAGVMAEVYGRLTGRPGVVFAQGAWLLANAAMGTLEGYMSGSPMVLIGDLTDASVLSHHAPYQSGAGDYGSWDARGAFRAFTKAVMVPTTAPQAVQQLQLAIKHAVSGQPGPVAYLLHSGCHDSAITPDVFPRLWSTSGYVQPTSQPADNAVVDASARAISAAGFPVILAGGGVRTGRAFDELARVARALGAPVVTTPGGKSTFPETDRLALGVFGTFGLPVANEALRRADLVLAVGTKLGATETANESSEILDPGRQTFVQIDLEPRHLGWTFPAEYPLLGDARTVLSQLSTALEGYEPDPSILRKRLRTIDELKQSFGYFDSGYAESEEAPLLPQRIISDLNAVVDDDAIVCCDAGENRIFMTHYYQTKSVDTFVQSAGVGGMGYGIPAALAAKLVHPDRQVIAVCGDGGFAMTMNGLMTALEEHISIVVVVFNNRALGWLRHEQEERDRVFVCDFPAYDHAAIARSMGCAGFRVDQPSQLRPVLREALAAGVPAVVDVMTSLSESFHRVTSPLIAHVAH